MKTISDYVTIGIAFILIAVSQGCRQNDDRTEAKSNLPSISWSGVSIDGGQYWINDEAVGQGAVGYEKVVKFIYSLPHDSEIVFRPLVSDYMILNEKFPGIDPLPFADNRVGLVEFERILAKGGIRSQVLTITSLGSLPPQKGDNP